jgi:hypothetical protein
MKLTKQRRDGQMPRSQKARYEDLCDERAEIVARLRELDELEMAAYIKPSLHATPAPDQKMIRG